jgi:hypothetical protein
MPHLKFTYLNSGWHDRVGPFHNDPQPCCLVERNGAITFLSVDADQGVC